jgi:hypothetical protein
MPSNPVDGGNCVSYNGTSISIENTESGKALQWIELNKSDGTKLLVCDRALVVSITWNNLNSAGLIFGKEVTIDGKKYKLRSLTGSTGASGTYGAGCDNEWDNLIDAVGESNDITHWSNMYSWCQETYYNNTSPRSVRGYGSARDYNGNNAADTYTYIGWRPALEVLNAAPSITPTSTSYGEKSGAFSIAYSVSDEDGDKFSVSVKIDGSEVESYTNQTNGSYTLDLSKYWKTLSKAAHTITITATDANSESTTATYTFTKTNSAPAAPKITTPINNLRIEPEGYVYYTPGTDPDGDTQAIKIEISESKDFTNAQTFEGMEKEVNGEWQTVTEITNEDAGASMRTKYSTTATGSVYIRAVATDSGSGTDAVSDTVIAAVGTVLQIVTQPYKYDTMPSKIALAIKGTIGEKATQTIEVCNNACDDAPTWETYAPENGLHTFSNETKTADDWAVATRITIHAGEETGAIEINAICEGVC